MRGPKLDRIDRQILDLLQSDGRMTNIELARRVGISPPPCLRRVRALEEAGLIRGYHADLAAEALGFGVTVFAQVGLQSQAEADLKAFETLVASWPEVREAHMLAGETDFLLKIVASDWDSYQRFLSARLTAAPECRACQIGTGSARLEIGPRHPDRRAAGRPIAPNRGAAHGETVRRETAGSWADTVEAGSRERRLQRFRTKPRRADLAGSAQHFVDLAGMQFLGVDHLPGIFLQHYRAPSTADSSSL